MPVLVPVEQRNGAKVSEAQCNPDVAPNVGFDERVVLDPTLFALEQLSRQGK